jgi:hypothetical protein
MDIKQLQYNKLAIWLSNPIKIGVIWSTDLLNWIYDPFKEFTRPVDPKYQELLFVKAKKFEDDLLQNFLLYGVIWNYRKPLDGSIDTGDQALWHGVSTAYWALKYSMTQDPEDLFQLNNSVIGLQLHQTIHGESKPRLIRGFRAMAATDYERIKYVSPVSWTNGDQKFFTKDQLVIEDNVSNDGTSGHLFGIYYAWKYGTPEIQALCSTLIRGLADELTANEYSLINADGSHTQYGELIQGVLTDPMRLSLCLAIFKVASVITGDSIYDEHYLKLRSFYWHLILYPKVKLWWWDNDNDTPRAAMQLYILAELEENSRWSYLYKWGLKRVCKVVRKTSNSFVELLNAKFNTPSGRYKDRLSEFTLEDKQFDTQKMNSTDLGYLTSQNIELFQWNKHLRSNQPLPVWKLGSQDFMFQRNLNSVDNYEGRMQPTQQFNGMDFLICWILGRKIGVISDKE